MRTTETINIVGAGLAGSILARLLFQNNIKYNIFDSGEKYAASKYSENIFSLGWEKRLGKEICNYSVNTLNKMVKVDTVYFKNINYIKSYRVKPKNILVEHIKDSVTSVNEDGVMTEENGFYKGITVLCAGIYNKDFINIKGLDALTGHGLLFEGVWKKDPAMLMPIPHRHFKAFQFDKNRIWFGDSTTVLHKNYIKRKNELIENSVQRAKKYFNLTGKYETAFGARPFVGKNTRQPMMGYHKKLNGRLHVLTGGWKMGLVIYPYLANKLMSEL